MGNKFYKSELSDIVFTERTLILLKMAGSCVSNDELEVLKEISKGSDNLVSIKEFRNKGLVDIIEIDNYDDIDEPYLEIINDESNKRKFITISEKGKEVLKSLKEYDLISELC